MPVDVTRWRTEIGIFDCALKSFSKRYCPVDSNLFRYLAFLKFVIILAFFIFCLSDSDSCIFVSLLPYFIEPSFFRLYPTYFSYPSIWRIRIRILHFLLYCAYHTFHLAQLLLLLCGDIEINPGPKNSYNLSVCHWNLNSIAAHNFSKLTSLEAYNLIHKYDIICLSETYLDSAYKLDDEALALSNYKLVRADHPDNVKRGGVCIYYKETLPVKFVNINFLTECLVCELCINNKKCILACIYRSPSQTTPEFHSFLTNFEQMLDFISNQNPFMVLIIGDLNARSKTWWTDDTTTSEGSQIEALTSSYGLMQMISDPTHILQNLSSCIDLLFTNQPNLITNSGVHSSLHPTCHHQVIFANIDLKIQFPPPYQRQV